MSNPSIYGYAVTMAGRDSTLIWDAEGGPSKLGAFIIDRCDEKLAQAVMKLLRDAKIALPRIAGAAEAITIPSKLPARPQEAQTKTPPTPVETVVDKEVVHLGPPAAPSTPETRERNVAEDLAMLNNAAERQAVADAAAQPTPDAAAQPTPDEAAQPTPDEAAAFPTMDNPTVTASSKGKMSENTAITALPWIPKRTMTALTNAGKTTVKDVFGMNNTEIEAIRGVGQKFLLNCADDIARIRADLGIVVAEAPAAPVYTPPAAEAAAVVAPVAVPTTSPMPPTAVAAPAAVPQPEQYPNAIGDVAIVKIVPHSDGGYLAVLKNGDRHRLNGKHEIVETLASAPVEEAAPEAGGLAAAAAPAAVEAAVETAVEAAPAQVGIDPAIAAAQFAAQAAAAQPTPAAGLAAATVAPAAAVGDIPEGLTAEQWSKIKSKNILAQVIEVLYREMKWTAAQITPWLEANFSKLACSGTHQIEPGAYGSTVNILTSLLDQQESAA